jgi:fucose permease
VTSRLGDAQYGSLFIPQLTLAALGALGAGLVLDRLGNWTIPFLTEERGLAPAEAALALAAFWGALSVGRLTVALVVSRVRPGPVLHLRLDLGTIYRLAALPPAVAALLALRVTATSTLVGSRRLRNLGG